MSESSSIEYGKPSAILIRMHDHIWQDKDSWPWQTRFETCDMLWKLALELVLEGR